MPLEDPLSTFLSTQSQTDPPPRTRTRQGARSSRRSLVLPALAIGVIAVTSFGCAGRAWKQALRTDSAAAYHEFIREHPGSKYVPDAEERIAFHRVMIRPTLEGYDRFRETHPDSELLDRIRPAVEDLAFDAARRIGTPAAYAVFEQRFPNGPHAKRGRGNVAYLEILAAGTERDPATLQAFAQRHPESDYAPEARRTLEALALRSQTRFDRVVLQIDVTPGTPEAERVRAEFIARAAKTYQHAGIDLRVAPPGAKVGSDFVVLRIAHREQAGTGNVAGSDISRAGTMVHTEVSLRRGSDTIWHRDFDALVSPQDSVASSSALFSSKQAKLYWDQFFVPIATWRSSAAVRTPVDAKRPVVGIDGVDGRAVVLYEDGAFDVLELADPEKPLRVVHHERNTTIEHFGGVTIDGDRILVYGQDGLEIVALGGEAPRTLVTRTRGEVGAIAGLHLVPQGLLIASARGVLLTDRDGGNAQRLMRRAVTGIDGEGAVLVLTDADSVYVTTLELLRAGRVIEQFRIGRAFEPSRVRVDGDLAVVMGAGGVLLFHVPASGIGKPRILSRFARRDIGDVRDALRIDGRVYLLGSRGLQLLSGDYARVEESVDVIARDRVVESDRHVIVAGGSHVQVVDALPFSPRASLPAKAGGDGAQ